MFFALATRMTLEISREETDVFRYSLSTKTASIVIV